MSESPAAFNGERLFVAESGQGASALLLHGLNASSHVFDPVRSQAEGRYRLRAVDLPCSGRSGRFGSMEPRSLAREIAQALLPAGSEPVLLVGHSFGGVVALELAVAYPERVKGLLVMGAPVLGYPWLQRWVTAKWVARPWGLLAPGLHSPPIVHAYLRHFWGKQTPFRHATAKTYAQAGTHPQAPECWLEAICALSVYQAPWEAIRQLGMPVRALWGSRDRLVPPRHGRSLELRGNVPLRLVNDAGHFLPEECPGEVVAEMDKLAGERQKEHSSALTPEGAAIHGT